MGIDGHEIGIQVALGRSEALFEIVIEIEGIRKGAIIGHARIEEGAQMNREATQRHSQ
jgi:hypothetical protein